MEKVFPEFPCHCGGGLMNLFKENTPKNPGRIFYKCPIQGSHKYAFLWAEPPTNENSSQKDSTTTASTSEIAITQASTTCLPSSDDEVNKKNKKKQKKKPEIVEDDYEQRKVHALESLALSARLILIFGLLVLVLICFRF